ncbi:hypothetical protein CsatB_029234 [Cannabis sativa]
MVYIAAIASLVYSIWKLRNYRIWQGVSIAPNRIVEETKGSIKMRVAMFTPKKTKDIDRDWFNEL